MDQAAEASARTGKAGLEIIDCDVHPLLRNGLADLYPYMEEPWRQRFIRKRASAAISNLTFRYLHPNGATTRDDARTPAGGPGGSDPLHAARHYLDPQGVSMALLTNLQSGGLAAVNASVDESLVLTSAANDYFAETWLAADRRWRYAMTLPVQDPQAAAAEIRRFGRHPQVAAAFLPPINTLLGARYWWPIYQAAQEHDLPILLHVTGTDSVMNTAPVAAGGQPDTYAERYVTLSLAAEANLTSLIFSGVFERFPQLRVMIVEYGFLWAVPLLWRMDRTWRALRHETPWVRRSPIDYVQRHVVFSTQPLDEPDDPRELERMIALLGHDVLCFSSDYPHWDNDMPGQSLRMLPEEARRKIFAGNARRVLRLS